MRCGLSFVFGFSLKDMWKLWQSQPSYSNQTSVIVRVETLQRGRFPACQLDWHSVNICMQIQQKCGFQQMLERLFNWETKGQICVITFHNFGGFKAGFRFTWATSAARFLNSLLTLCQTLHFCSAGSSLAQQQPTTAALSWNTSKSCKCCISHSMV